jgi:hypothetical protein
MNALAEEIYEPVVLNALGRAIFEFCRRNPHVAFNAPPDLQPEFQNAIEELREATAQLKYLYRENFFANRPLIDWLKNIGRGDMCLVFIPDKKVGGLTILAKIENIWRPDSIPPNWKLIVHETRNFRRYFGGGGLWTSCIAAITRVDQLTREMCWIDPGRIFMAKAVKYGF